MDYTPPTLTMDDITILLQHMQPEDVKKFNEYCMIHFPNWLFKVIKREAELCNMSFEQFVRIACMEVARNRIVERSNDEANGNVQATI